MATNPIPTLADVKDFLQIPSDVTTRDSMISRLLNGALDYVERISQRQFSTGVETRFYDGNDKGYLLVDDYQRDSITRIVVSYPGKVEAYAIATGNVAGRGERPQDSFHNRIDIVNYVTENPYRVLGPSPYVFPSGIQNVEITANFGTWNVLPDGLQNIIIELVAAKVSMPAGGTIRSMSVGGESLTFSDTDFSPTMRRSLQAYAKPMVEIFPS
jgi:hypothetical protein